MAKVVQVTTVAQIAFSMNSATPFIHLYNVSDSNVYVCYDGSVATVATGVPLPPGGVMMLNNDGNKPIFVSDLSLITDGVGNKEVRIQGAS